MIVAKLKAFLAQTLSGIQKSEPPMSIFDCLNTGRCPDCGSKQFYEGPSGGMCQNVKCADCGSKFNMGMGLITERIGGFPWLGTPWLCNGVALEVPSDRLRRPWLRRVRSASFNNRVW